MHTITIILIILSQRVQLQIIPDLPSSHLIRYLNTFPQLSQNCDHGNNCHSRDANDSSLCWGFEHNCKAESRLQPQTLCPGDHTGWVSSKQAQFDAFFYQADFGYVRQQRDELMLLCEPKFVTDSSLECSSYLRFCRGRNLLFDFRDLLKRTEPIRYDMDVLQPGQVLGHCRFNRSRLQVEMDHNGALQSWSPELRNFDELPAAPIGSKEWCDEVIDTPTFIMKIDATYNMYHHFCDFFNLYASLFVNQSHPLAFDTDVRILIWESYPYDSPFAETFSAFTRHSIWTLNEVKGKRICFRNVVLPLLPRMIFGLFYNTPIIQGCEGSGLFHAFSEFILHRLRVPFYAPASPTKVRITFLSRRTKYRRVLNENELLEEIASNENYYVRRISFDRGISFTEQLAITRNTDVLIGMHGAGLTHLLFLPNWATVFELHNCQDPNCYKDLARLRGVHYLTWEKQEFVYPQDEGHHPQGGAHAKFTNYSFNCTEFARMVALAATHVRTHKEFQAYNNETATSHHKEEL